MQRFFLNIIIVSLFWVSLSLAEQPSSVRVQQLSDLSKISIMKNLGTITYLLDPNGNTKNSMYMGFLNAKPLAEVAEHIHDNSDEILFIIKGDGEMTIGSEKYTLSDNMFIFIPKGIKHSLSLKNAKQNISAIQLYSPSGPEQRFKQVQK